MKITRGQLCDQLRGGAFITNIASWGAVSHDELGERYLHLEGGWQEQDYKDVGCLVSDRLENDLIAQGILGNMILQRGHSESWAEWALHRVWKERQPPEEELDRQELGPGFYM